MITKEEVMAKYGDVPCAFVSYYKYSFSFRGTAEDGAVVSLSVGGSSDDIYRYEVTPETRKTLRDSEYSYARVTINDEQVWADSLW